MPTAPATDTGSEPSLSREADPSPPDPDQKADITRWLLAWREGDAGAFEQVVQSLHQDFLRMAASRLRGYGDLSLSQGDVLHEAILRLMRSATPWANRAHFFATVSLTMRSVLREHARARLADKRHGERVEITLSELGHGEDGIAADLLTLDRLLDELARRDPRGAEVLQLTYFAGLRRVDIAMALDISVPTVDRELRFAKAWLSQQLGRHVGG
jgi:RNA polymerase sigma factor (TIGR02999 family)